MRHYPLLAIRLGCRYVLAAVFLMAAVTKITDLSGFTDEMVLHSGMPYYPALAVAAILPWLELTCGLCLALGYGVREAALILVLLLLALLCYSVTHLGQTDCHCFLFPTRTPEWKLWPTIRNSLLLACALVTCRRVPTSNENARVAGSVQNGFADLVAPAEEPAAGIRLLRRTDLQD